MNPVLPSCFDPEHREDKLSNYSDEIIENVSKKINLLYDKLYQQFKDDEDIKGLFKSVNRNESFY
mgnify:CR=1 FL=1